MAVMMVLIAFFADSADVSNRISVSPPSAAGAVITTIGSAVIGAGALMFKLSADGSYGDYKNARNTADAISFRDRTETYDKLAAWTTMGAGGMLVSTVVLWVRYETLLGRYKRNVGVRASLKKEGLWFGAYARF